ncbi:MAG: diaminopimelate decarboxylase [Gemmatimonadota bacterium]
MTPTHRAAVEVALLQEIAERVGTPAYVYDGRALDASVARWVRAVDDPRDVCYSVKANSNLSILHRLARHGIEFEVATRGELARVRRAGIAARRVVFGGVPKEERDVAEAIRAGVGLLVLQAENELEAALRHASPAVPVRIAVRVRPGIEAGTHPSLQTAGADAKFGVSPAELPDVWGRLDASPGLMPCGLAVHLGSGLRALEPYRRALDVLLGLVRELAGAPRPVTEIDIGGGLGIDYEGGADPQPGALIALVRERVANREIRVRYEPGRSIVARSGLLLTRVLYRRERDGSPALVCDAGHTDFSRYALYGAHHRIEPLAGRLEGPPTVAILGPTCESGDVLGVDRPLHGVRRGDLLVVSDVGAYGFVMASNYNSRPRPVEVLVDGGEWRVIREREALSDMWRGESLPRPGT